MPSLNPTHRVAFLVSCFGVLFGFGIASIAGVLDTLKLVFQLSVMGEQALVAVLVVSCFFGAVLAGPVSLRWGRRSVILLAAVFAMAGYGIMFATPGFAWFVASRIIVGVSVGLSSMVIPMYAAETTLARRRGAVVALFQLAITAGILIAYSVSLAFVALLSWELILGSGILAASLGLLAILLLPESPRWLVSKGRMAAARQATGRLGLLEEWPVISHGQIGRGQSNHAGAAVDADGKNLLRAGFRQGSTMAVLMLCSVLLNSSHLISSLVVLILRQYRQSSIRAADSSTIITVLSVAVQSIFLRTISWMQALTLLSACSAWWMSMIANNCSMAGSLG